jgi:hypothetical protein
MNSELERSLHMDAYYTSGGTLAVLGVTVSVFGVLTVLTLRGISSGWKVMLVGLILFAISSPISGLSHEIGVVLGSIGVAIMGGSFLLLCGAPPEQPSRRVSFLLGMVAVAFGVFYLGASLYDVRSRLSLPPNVYYRVDSDMWIWLIGYIISALCVIFGGLRYAWRSGSEVSRGTTSDA